MTTVRATLLSALLLLPLAGCVAYEPYAAYPAYPTYSAPVVVAPPPIAVYPRYGYGGWYGGRGPYRGGYGHGYGGGHGYGHGGGHGRGHR